MVWIRDSSSRIQRKTYPRYQIQIQRSKKHRILDSGSETLLTGIGRIQYRTELSKYGSHLFHLWLCVGISPGNFSPSNHDDF
jgi:hypothetical protein